MPPVELFDYVLKGGLPAIFALIIYAGYKEWWVWGRHHQEIVRELKRDRDEWKGIALKATGLGEKALDVAQTTTRRRAAP